MRGNGKARYIIIGAVIVILMAASIAMADDCETCEQEFDECMEPIQSICMLVAQSETEAELYNQYGSNWIYACLQVPLYCQQIYDEYYEECVFDLGFEICLPDYVSCKNTYSCW